MKIGRKRSLNKVSSLLEEYDYVLYEYDETDNVFNKEIENFFGLPIKYKYIVLFLFAGKINRIGFQENPYCDGVNWTII